MTSNYPPGMTQRDWDHVNGVSRCAECGAELDEDAEGDTCPGGCYEEDWDTLRELREENDYDRRMGL